MLRLPPLFALASALVATNSVTLAGDLTAGQTLFKVCAVCHDIGEKAQNRVGPILNGLDGSFQGVSQSSDGDDPRF
jgi:cytochrome c